VSRGWTTKEDARGGVKTAAIPEWVGEGADRGSRAGARRERRDGAEVGPAGVGCRAKGWHQLVHRRILSMPTRGAGR
jgi:hypothetical protein